MDKLNSKHIIFIILGLCVISLQTYPTIITRICRNDSWICIMISSLLFLIFSIYIIYVCKKTNCSDIFKIYTSSFGKIIGYFFICIFIISILFTMIECPSVEASSFHTNMFLETPTWFPLLFFIPTGIYTIKKGNIAIIIITIVGITLIMISEVFIQILTIRYERFKYLFPIFQSGITREFIYSIFKSLGLYGFIILAIPFIDEVQNKRHLIRHSLIGLIIAAIMEIVLFIVLISSFGIERLNTIYYPKFIQTQVISYSSFLESGEFFILLQASLGWYIKYILAFYALTKILKSMNIDNKYLVYIISIIIYIASFFVSRNLFLLFRLLDYFSYICLMNFVIIPLIAFTIFYIKYVLGKNKVSGSQ